MLCGAVLVNVCLGSLFSWSLFVAPIGETFDRSAAALSGVFSVAVITFAAIAMAGGGLVDRAAPRTTVVGAAVAAAAGLLVAASATSLLWVVVGYGVLFGIGNGLGYATAVAVGGKAFDDRRGAAVGAIVGAYAAGPLVASPLITALLDRVGWRGALVVLSAGIGVLLLAGAALLGGRLPAGAAQRPGTRRGRPLLAHPRGALLWLAFLLGTLPALMIVAHAAAIAGAAGLGVAATSAAVALLGAGNLAGRAGGGWLSDRLGRLPGLRAATATLALACVSLTVAAGTGAVLAALILAGAGYGVQSALVPALTADLFGTERFAANYGQVFTGWGVAGLLGPQVGAWLGDASGGFAAALWWGTGSAALALAVYLALPRVGQVRGRPGTDADRPARA